MEDVDGVDGEPARLLVAEDEVDPGGNVTTDMLRLEGLTMDEGEETGVTPTPGRQAHALDTLPGLTHPKVKP